MVDRFNEMVRRRAFTAGRFMSEGSSIVVASHLTDNLPAASNVADPEIENGFRALYTSNSCRQSGSCRVRTPPRRLVVILIVDCGSSRLNCTTGLFVSPKKNRQGANPADHFRYETAAYCLRVWEGACGSRIHVLGWQART